MTPLAQANAARWAKARLTRGPEFRPASVRLVANKARYKAVEKNTGVPWFVIAVIHERESGANFSRSLAQGDPWNERSKHIPKGRGPFNSWEEAAMDALIACPPYAARNVDWSVGGTLALLERYNGLGYANRGLPSPYIWSGTDQYTKGKYVRDGVFDPNAVDKQLGCAGLLIAMMALDPSIQLGTKRVGDPIITVPPVTRPATPSVSNPAPGSVGAKLVSWFNALFGRKA